MFNYKMHVISEFVCLHVMKAYRVGEVYAQLFLNAPVSIPL